MKTTLDLCQKLIREATKVSNQRTKTGVDIMELARKHSLQEIKEFERSVDLEIDLAAARNRK